MATGKSKKILLASANPKNTTQLRLAEEAGVVIEKLRRFKKTKNFEFALCEAARIEDFRIALLVEKPNLVHFAGHGTTNGLVFEYDNGQPHVVDVEAFANLLKFFADHVECVLLNACYSAEQAKAVNRSVRHVVGMWQPISDQAAIKFTTGFYDALGDGRSYEEAYKWGCNAIHLEGLSEHITPVWYFKDTAVRIHFVYALKDQNLAEDLLTHLEALCNGADVEITDNHDIVYANEPTAADAPLNRADIILLGVSAAAVNSRYAHRPEIERAMERHEEKAARVIPVLLRECVYLNAPFAALKPLPFNNQPIESWGNRAKACTDVTAHVAQIVEKIREQKL